MNLNKNCNNFLYTLHLHPCRPVIFPSKVIEILNCVKGREEEEYIQNEPYGYDRYIPVLYCTVQGEAV